MHILMQKDRIRIMIVVLFLIGFVSCLMLSVSTTFLFLEKSPNIYESKIIEVKHAGNVRILVKRIINEVTSQKQRTFIFAEEEELNALVAFGSRTLQSFSGHISIENIGMKMLITLKIPENPIGRYINIRIYLAPSDKGLNISEFVIGKIQIHNTIVKLFLKLVLNSILGNGQGNDVLNAIEKVTFKDSVVTVQFTPLPDIKFRFNVFKNRLENIRDSINPICDPDLVKVYYRKLIEIERNFQPGQTISLSEYMTPLFELANQNSKSGNYSKENKAAILALTVYAGSWQFEKFIGNVRTENMVSNPLIIKNIVLAGRQDLRLHFILSAGIKVISDSRISFAAGEFKELLDALYGGTGFSFADLAADRAGTYFAQMAIANNSEAEKLQRGIIKNPEENFFFPDIFWTPEGISQDQFKSEFENVESEQYKYLIEVIDKQIMRLPLYNYIG